MDADAREDRVARAAAIVFDAPARVLAIVGPTASGKTDLAIAIAELIDAEIVSVDSVQIYRYFDIGSGKPSRDELGRVPHHLIDAIEPNEPIDAARFAERGRAAIADIVSRGKRVVLCGGTFLWAKALLFGLAEAPPGSEEIRARHRAIVESRGRSALHDALRAVDPESSARLHPNDVVRVSRALEVHEQTGTGLTEWQRAHAFRTPLYDARIVAITTTTEALTRRIERRVDAMLAAGWKDEVASLLARGFGGARAMGAVGYRDVRACVAGELPDADLARTIVRSTRIFARRQRTWLNRETVTWL